MDVEKVRIATPFGRDLIVSTNGTSIAESTFVARKRQATIERTRHPLLREAQSQVRAYFAKRLVRFDLPLLFTGTPFACEIYALVANLETGELISYGDVARALGRPFAHRSVAAAMGCSSHALFVPAHRVIGADGRIKGAAPNSIRRRLLAHEGITLR
jgi:methylated-DNA-[protein]-cysteine S-methyltransferase